jgi:pseudouridine kinase
MKREITVVGGITADIEGVPLEDLVFQDSNPGKIRISYGGVGRNIAENLARLGLSVAMVSAVGKDFVGVSAKGQLEGLGVDVSQVVQYPEESTAMYLSILNILGDMEMGLCNMDVLEKITMERLYTIIPWLKESEILCLDTNLSEDLLLGLTEALEGVPLFLDPVSVAKAPRVRKSIGRFHTIKPNRMEAEEISGLTILSREDLELAGNWFLGQGVKRLFITLGSGGVYYQEGEKRGLIPVAHTALESATGAGDAFSAAVLVGHLREWDVEKTAKVAMEASRITMESKSPVNPDMSMDLLLQRVEGGKKSNA